METLKKISVLGVTVMILLHGGGSLAIAESSFPSPHSLKGVAELYQANHYFKSARYAFASLQTDPSLKPLAYGWITRGLLKAGFPNAASYFFIRTLQMGDHAAIVSVLSQTEDLMNAVGSDLIRKYLVRHTQLEDYDARNRGAYLFSLAKDELLSGATNRALETLNRIPQSSSLWPYGLQLRGTANAILGKNEAALRDFRECASQAGQIVGSRGKKQREIRSTEREADDLQSRCVAGEARTYYQMDKFDEADRTYDSIQKKSFVWPDILFEQAWNSFARREYNRTLGKLVSYKSPDLSFIFNSEIPVLRAQAYLALCLYEDANNEANHFNEKFSAVGVEVKDFVERNANDLPAFYEVGKKALSESLYTHNDFYRLANRFVRSPYFEDLVQAEHQVSRELAGIRKTNVAGGFPGFLEQVLRWRLKSIELLGGAFVKNSLIDYHTTLISDFDKMSFIKLEMIRQAKNKLIHKESNEGERDRGNVLPTRRDDQYYWSFNGEFWWEEMGDYVFGLESACNSSSSPASNKDD